MSDYHLAINGAINLGDYSSIYDYMGVIGERDKITITMNNADSENFQMLCNILRMKNFIIISKEENINGEYCITAFKEETNT